MTGNHYRNGRRHEYLARDDLEAHGYQVIRAAGSKGNADLVALKPGEVLLVQVKISGPQIAPQERTALFGMAEAAGAVALVAHKPSRQPITYRRLTGAGPKDWQPWTLGEPETPIKHGYVESVVVSGTCAYAFCKLPQPDAVHDTRDKPHPLPTGDNPIHA